MSNLLNQSSLVGCQGKIIKDGRFYKEDIDRCYESISEVLVDELCTFIKGLSPNLHYYLDNSVFKFGCYSKLYTKGNKLVDVSWYNLLNDSDEYNHILDLVYEVPTETYYNGIIMAIEDITCCKVRKFIEDVLLLDYITLNTDRHLDNIQMLLNMETGVYTTAPIIDNGRALLSDTLSFSMSMDLDRAYRICKQLGKPFSESFDTQLQLIYDNRKLEIDYVKLKERLVNVLENIDEYVPFKKREFKRAVKFLMYSLDKSNGKAWEDVRWIGKI